jgi:AsmA family protein
VTGPITIRMGPAVWASEKAGDAEAMMTNAFAAKGAGQIDFECVAVALPFQEGVATAHPIIGFSTAASALITSGKVDLREESLDVSGRVKPKSGVSLGLATIAGNVKIAGPLRHPKMTLDPAGTPELIARAGAAIATLGISAVGTAMVDAAQAKKNDPCEVR